MASMASPANSSLPSIGHFRDVGASINKRAGKKHLKEGVLYISQPISEATEADSDRLRNEYKIRTVVETLAPKNTFIVDPSNISAYKPEHPDNVQITKLLGLTSCRIGLRGFEYNKKYIVGDGWWEKA